MRLKVGLGLAERVGVSCRDQLGVQERLEVWLWLQVVVGLVLLVTVQVRVVVGLGEVE